MYKLSHQMFIQKNVNVLPSAYTCVQRSLLQMKNKVNEVVKTCDEGVKKVDGVDKKYESRLEKKFPRALHVYRMFSGGYKEFILDMKRYLAALMKRTAHGVDSLSTEELHLIYKLSKDFKTLSPFLLISLIPFTNVILIPIALYYPRQFLTSHFWSLQQKLDFMLIDHKERLKHNKPLFRCMQAEVNNIKDQELKAKWSDIIACLGNGTHPLPKDIIACSKLFEDGPYSLARLNRNHMIQLAAIYGDPSWKPFKIFRLLRRGELTKQMDLAIQREGGVTQMSNDALRSALFFRGLNPANMSMESMRNWLEQWITVSETVNDQTISLLLHSPVLLASNHSSNLILIDN